MPLVATVVRAGTAVSSLRTTEDRASGADLDASNLTKAYDFMATPCGHFGASMFAALCRSGTRALPHRSRWYRLSWRYSSEFAEGVAIGAHRVVTYIRVRSCGGDTA
jgi:hypothetical protein